FPGNVRELENLLHRAVALSNHATLEPEDLGLADAVPPLDEVAAHDGITPPPLQVAPEPTPALADVQAIAAVPSDLAAHLDKVERDILVLALEKHRLNRTAAGASMGLSLRQMRYRMARLGVQVTDQGIVLGERFDPDADSD